MKISEKKQSLSVSMSKTIANKTKIAKHKTNSISLTNRINDLDRFISTNDKKLSDFHNKINTCISKIKSYEEKSKNLDNLIKKTNEELKLSE